MMRRERSPKFQADHDPVTFLMKKKEKEKENCRTHTLTDEKAQDQKILTH
jgi:hypothetical protein